MRLHENKILFQDAVVATSQQKGIREIYVEKDYWITFALHHVFKSEIGKETVFKGGTALSKCFGLISRFSEDIDLVVLQGEDETHNQLKNKIKKISTYVSEILPEIQVEGITNKMGMIRKTAHTYPRLFKGHFGQVRDMVIVEASRLGNFEPNMSAKVCSLIHDMMVQTDQQKLIDEYKMQPFAVLVLDPKRTFCEKIMSLVRFSHTQDPIGDLRNKIRHIYDIHLMLKDETLNSFFQSDEFEIMLLRVGIDDVESYKSNNAWLAEHPVNSIIFSETASVWSEIKDVYTGSFRELVFSELPPGNDLLKTLTKISRKLDTVKWNIKL